VKEQPAMIEIGKAKVIQNFSNNGQPKVAFFALGPMRDIVDDAIEELGTDNIDAAIINPLFIKPIDGGTTEFFAEAADVLITIEDHVLRGGYGSIVRDHLADTGIRTPVVRIGWPDQFIEHASSVGYLREKHGLTGVSAAEQIRQALDQVADANPALGQAVGE
jgi:1-deoxy-D-xylulose-5-phosphate synthase